MEGALALERVALATVVDEKFVVRCVTKRRRAEWRHDRRRQRKEWSAPGRAREIR